MILSRFASNLELLNGQTKSQPKYYCFEESVRNLVSKKTHQTLLAVLNLDDKVIKYNIASFVVNGFNELIF